MKICRFKDPETQRPSYGIIVGEEVSTLRGDLNAGDRLTVETPGGGGVGSGL